MKIIPTWTRVSLPRLHLNGSSGSQWPCDPEEVKPRYTHSGP